jgi:hypothetical protein
MKRDTKSAIVTSVLALLMLPAWTQGYAQRWSEAKANARYGQEPWLGGNYVPGRTCEDKEADRGKPRSAS